MKYLKMYENMEEKILILIYIMDHVGESKFNKWTEAQEKFNDLDVDWWVKPQSASYLGLGFQSILNTPYIEQAEKIAEYIQSEFDEKILICLSKEYISRKEPVGESHDKGWIKIGRAFDKMVSDGVKGIHIL